MATVQQELLARISDPCNLDAGAEEVFGTMLGVACRREASGAIREGESVCAMVGFGGVLSGACIVRAGIESACKIAGRMTGMEFAEIDATVLDGMGEICNMLAGSWKGRIPELAAHCGLSVPAVITGHHYNLHLQAPKFELLHLYCAEDIRFEVRIVCDGLQ
ncbi:MAG: chemotaxis protein CheX [Acidobacteriota bacterium]